MQSPSKDDGARLHAGVTAQLVKEAFEAEGQDAFSYGPLCYDKSEDQWEERGDEYETIPADEDEAGRIVEPVESRLIRRAGA
ncbi:hypothetical protein [Sinorhizobium medicae]|uniref:Uncharacterized protein n=1 Tax=Sinorhizobium medicae TaxID=110321 RepID=A0ABX4TWP9_9HYPH|nr:hypothetical protein [Sinorhizobium medicae]MDX0717163.1 hypothetical protein [Sinorhizobium medicae]MDX0846709.1 hypothetical protein [Sinorhizobium medicae]MDX1060575.1 hypothetical protein [Sinorhizobium medicae]PLU09357.1 hypothetical protein BMJ33_01140 [Sinorhizobium medicae]PLU21335.1 hypothetical protein BMJ29_11670 [Sinorhizobium medicae]